MCRGGRGDHPDRDRVRAAALPDAQPAPGAEQGPDPRPGLELRLRRPGQRRRALHLLPAQEGRRRPRADDPHHARRGLRAQARRAARPEAGDRAPTALRSLTGRLVLTVGRPGGAGQRPGRSASTAFAMRGYLTERLDEQVLRRPAVALAPGAASWRSPTTTGRRRAGTTTTGTAAPGTSSAVLPAVRRRPAAPARCSNGDRGTTGSAPADRRRPGRRSTTVPRRRTGAPASTCPTPASYRVVADRHQLHDRRTSSLVTGLPTQRRSTSTLGSLLGVGAGPDRRGRAARGGAGRSRSYAGSCGRCARSRPPPTRCRSCRWPSGEIDLDRSGCPTT